MADGKRFSYDAQLKKLRSSGPERLYLLYGEEDYLRESLLEEIKKSCLSQGEADFNYKRFNALQSLQPLAEAVDTMPFFADRTLVEVRDFDINKCRNENAEEFKRIVSGIPEYCTLVLVLGTGYEPDGRMAAVKAAKKYGSAIEFTSQSQQQLINWISRRFASLGKQIGRAQAEHLIFVSGALMSRLIQEIEKLASYAKGPEISKEDIDTVAERIPEANVFDMTEQLSRGNFPAAMSLLWELLYNREHPVMILATIGNQYSRLYAARLAMDHALGIPYVLRVCNLKYEFIARKLMDIARRYTLSQLAAALRLCAGTDYAMKSTGLEDEALLKDLLLKLATGDVDDQGQ